MCLNCYGTIVTNYVNHLSDYVLDNSAQTRAGVFELPDSKSGENSQELKSIWKFESPEDQKCRCVDWHPTKASRLAVVYDKEFCIWDFGTGSPQVSTIFKQYFDCDAVLLYGVNTR